MSWTMTITVLLLQAFALLIFFCFFVYLLSLKKQLCECYLNLPREKIRLMVDFPSLDRRNQSIKDKELKIIENSWCAKFAKIVFSGRSLFRRLLKIVNLFKIWVINLGKYCKKLLNLFILSPEAGFYQKKPQIL